MGDSRKYQYHTTGGILAFQGGGGFLDWNSESMGGEVEHFGILNAWGGGKGVKV